LEEDKSPSRKAKELDNRGSHFYLALYWAQALAKQTKDAELQALFAKTAASLTENETIIVNELNDAQGSHVDIDGYYFPSVEKVQKAMCPSQTLNAILEGITSTQLA